MKFVSTRGGAPAVDFRTALFNGLAPDGGLYVPAALAPLGADQRTALGVAKYFVGDEIATDRLDHLLTAALDFETPLHPITERLAALELFHGPTFAFKDVGARVMARLMASLHAGDRALTVLVATSGDTGSAVAQAFFGVEATRVIVLFPDGQVSAVQEAQFTTLGGNVTAAAVAGTFDDCQRLVKEAFADAGLRSRAQLTSANSINIGRLIPQIFYYLSAAAESETSGRAASRGAPELVFSVPSGNFGNLTAGLFARTLGAPIGRFVAATTVNDTLPRYMATGRYQPRPSVATLANAMDVGNPSNVERMRWLFHDDVAAMREVITPSVHTDDEVRDAIGDMWREHRYLLDPHSAIGYLGTTGIAADERAVFLATAHPAKFREVVEPIIGERIALPAALEEALGKPRRVEHIPPRLDALRDLL